MSLAVTLWLSGVVGEGTFTSGSGNVHACLFIDHRLSHPPTAKFPPSTVFILIWVHGKYRIEPNLSGNKFHGLRIPVGHTYFWHLHAQFVFWVSTMPCSAVRFQNLSILLRGKLCLELAMGQTLSVCLKSINYASQCGDVSVLTNAMDIEAPYESSPQDLEAFHLKLQ